MKELKQIIEQYIKKENEKIKQMISNNNNACMILYHLGKRDAYIQIYKEVEKCLQK